MTERSAEEALAWEAAGRTRAGYASILAGILLFASFAYGAVGFSDSPSVTLTDGFADALSRPLSDGQKGLLTEPAVWFKDNAVELLLSTLVGSIGSVLVALALGYLFRATVARRPETSRFILALVLVGPILTGIGPLVGVVGAILNSNDYVDGGVFSTVGAHDALRENGWVTFAAVFGLFGSLAIAGGILFLSLNAMRVGLLTRFTGILGCIVGALLLLRVLGPPVIVQSAWLVILGMVILGRGTVPPAWRTGRAEPWPSQQELREQRERGNDVPPPKPDVEVEPTGTGSVVLEKRPHPASQKRKRKRR